MLGYISRQPCVQLFASSRTSPIVTLIILFLPSSISLPISSPALLISLKLLLKPSDRWNAFVFVHFTKLGTRPILKVLFSYKKKYQPTRQTKSEDAWHLVRFLTARRAIKMPLYGNNAYERLLNMTIIVRCTWNGFALLKKIGSTNKIFLMFFRPQR